MWNNGCIGAFREGALRVAWWQVCIVQVVIQFAIGVLCAFCGAKFKCAVQLLVLLLAVAPTTVYNPASFPSAVFYL